MGAVKFPEWGINKCPWHGCRAALRVPHWRSVRCSGRLRLHSSGHHIVGRGAGSGRRCRATNRDGAAVGVHRAHLETSPVVVLFLGTRGGGCRKGYVRSPLPKARTRDLTRDGRAACSGPTIPGSDTSEPHSGEERDLPRWMGLPVRKEQSAAGLVDDHRGGGSHIE